MRAVVAVCCSCVAATTAFVTTVPRTQPHYYLGLAPRRAVCFSPLQPQASSRGGEEAVVIAPSLRLPFQFLAAGLVLDTVPYVQWTLGPLVTALALLFFVQCVRLRFVFERDAFALQESSLWSGEDRLTETGENIVVGGENRWAYKSFVNYDSFPKGWIDQPQGPILIYFKETQTPEDKWDEGPGKSANSEEALANGAKRGQVHFFPALCDAKALLAEFEKRGCQKLA